MKTSTAAWPCSLAVTVATGERGVAYVQWADGSYAVKLDSGAWIEATPSELTFVGAAKAAT